MKTIYATTVSLLAVILLATACTPTPTAAPPTQAPTDTGMAVTDTPAATSMAVTDTPAATEGPTDTAAPAMETPSMAATPSGPATISTGKNDTLGSFLTDDHGMTLYIFTKDTPNTSTCSGKCAATWPPLLTNGTPVAGDGVDGTKLSTTTRADGTTQVTYNGWPLYYYSKDAQAGDTMGQGVISSWYVISPAGDQITK